MEFILIFCTFVVVWLNRGRYDPSVPVLTLFFLTWVGSVVSNRNFFQKLNPFLTWLPWLGALLFAFRTELLYVSPEILPLMKVLRFSPLFGLFLFSKKWRAKWIGVAFFLLPLLLVPFLSPSPHIDVFQNNQLAVDYFLHGVNPYAAVYPDIYKNEFDYHPGFLYWPGALIFETLSQILFHDIRGFLILAWAIAAFFLRDFKKWIALWLCIPFLAFGLEQAWLDPLIALGGALTLYGIRTKKHFLWIIGVVIAATVKQYGFLIGLFSVLYFVLENGIPKSRKLILMMGLLFAAVMVPFIAWGPNEFLQMTVFTHATAKVRPDALNFTAFWLKVTGAELSNLIQLFAILVGMGLATFHVVKNRSTRSLRVVPEGWAIFFGFSVYFGKFAFCNYHWLLCAFLIFAAAEGFSFQDSTKNGTISKVN